jgi:probable addiction module antidote protein
MAIRSSSYRDEFFEALADPEEAAEYLNAAARDSQESLLMALRDVAQARQMAKVAEGAGVKRESLYRTLSAQGNPTLDTFTGVLGAVGLYMVFAPIHEGESQEVGADEKPEEATPVFMECKRFQQASTTLKSIQTQIVLLDNLHYGEPVEVVGPMKVPMPKYKQQQPLAMLGALNDDHTTIH